MSSWRGELVERLASLGLRPEREAEIVEELSQHLDDRVRDLVAHGAEPATARAAALADLDVPGELARRLAEIVPRPLNLPPPGAPSRGRWLQARWQDVRHSARSLRRSPAFTASAIVTSRSHRRPHHRHAEHRQLAALAPDPRCRRARSAGGGVGGPMEEPGRCDRLQPDGRPVLLEPRRSAANRDDTHRHHRRSGRRPSTSQPATSHRRSPAQVGSRPTSSTCWAFGLRRAVRFVLKMMRFRRVPRSR